MDNATHTEHKSYPPCNLACPILTDAREYVQLIAERRFAEAYASIRNLNPLPSICGRICTHPCETACKRGQVDEPIAIAALKRFAADGPWAAEYKVRAPEQSTGHKVAVVGSGPAGLSAAHDLALLGHHVTIFEALPVLGGMLRVGVPAYRLPKDVLEEEIQAIVDLGIEVKTGVRIGEEITLSGLLEQGYKAVFVAIGAHKDRKLGIAGEDEREGVVSAVSFLQGVNWGQSPEVGKKVAVIGGGNTAVDSARSALRLGAKEVYILYRRTSEEMPAASEEVEEATEEGVQITYLTSPVEILGKEGKVSGLKCVKNQLGDADASGRRSPESVPGSEFSLDVDMVIAAIGQAPDSSLLADELELEKGNRIVVEDGDRLAATRAGVFAGGDAVTGPATAIKAIAAGKQAAVSIDMYLRGVALPKAEPLDTDKTQELPAAVVDKSRHLPRCEVVCQPVEKRLAGFDELASGLEEMEAIREARRCLHCYLGAELDHHHCISCGACVKACPLEIPHVGTEGKVHIDAFQCQACGTCVAECPVQAINLRFYPYRYILGEVRKALRQLEMSYPVVVGVFSQYGNFATQHLEALGRDFPEVLPVMIFGLERVSLSDLLEVFRLGVDGILVGEGPSENRPFFETDSFLEKRSRAAKEILDLLGLGGARLISYTMPPEGLFEASWLAQTLDGIKALGPNPLRKDASAA